MKIPIIAAIGVLSLFNSCEESFKPETEVPIELQSYEKQVAYVKQNFKILAQLVLSQAKDPEFRKILYQQIEKRMDGDDNVLIETLAKIQTANGTIGARMSESSKEGNGTYAEEV